MKSSTLVVTYLLKDTWFRWREYPGNLASRLFVGILLVAVSSVILASFSILEKSLTRRLDKFGINTIVIRDLPGNSQSNARKNGESGLAALQDHGRLLTLKHHLLSASAQGETRHPLQALSYPPEALPLVAHWLTPEIDLICLSETLPENGLVQITLGDSELPAIVRRPDDFFRPLTTTNLLLIPSGLIPEIEASNFIRTTLFQRHDKTTGIPTYIRAIERYFDLNHERPPRIQSAVALANDLDVLRRRKELWQTILSAMLGASLALVYGAMAVLEYRQNRFDSALLRSFGAPPLFLIIQRWLENALAANIAALLALLLLALFSKEIFITLQFSRTAFSGSATQFLENAQTGLIFSFVNLGALLSTIPVALALRQPVGRILS